MLFNNDWNVMAKRSMETKHPVDDKKLIYVNDGDKFRSREDIFNEAIRFINL